MITKYRTQVPTVRPFNNLMNSMLGGDISQFFGHDDAGQFTPQVNITETPEKFVLSLHVPGFGKEQLTIHCEKDILTVTGEKSRTANTENERFLRREFHSSSFSRSFRLPETVKTETITAEHLNGVLLVSVPKTEPAKPAARAITIA